MKLSTLIEACFLGALVTVATANTCDNPQAKLEITMNIPLPTVLTLGLTMETANDPDTMLGVYASIATLTMDNPENVKLDCKTYQDETLIEDGDGYYYCTDTDECNTIVGEPVCDVSTSTCSNTPGCYECNCHEGYASDGNFNCLDINECTIYGNVKDFLNGDDVDMDSLLFEQQVKLLDASLFELYDSGASNDVLINALDAFYGCNFKGTCSNTEGSYTCSCDAGYMLSFDGKTCVSELNCETPLACPAISTGCSEHTHGVDCSCPDGYVNFAPRICKRSEDLCLDEMRSVTEIMFGGDDVLNDLKSQYFTMYSKYFEAPSGLVDNGCDVNVEINNDPVGTFGCPTTTTYKGMDFAFSGAYGLDEVELLSHQDNKQWFEVTTCTGESGSCAYSTQFACTPMRSPRRAIVMTTHDDGRIDVLEQTVYVESGCSREFTSEVPMP